MNLTNLNDLKSLLGKFKIKLNEKMGQNFLIERDVLEKIVAAGELEKFDTVLEIGPGVGTLTLELSKKSKKVIVIEKDKKLLKPLQSVLRGVDNVEVINEDFLNFDFSEKLRTAGYKLVSNIPYYITGEILKKVFSARQKPALIVLLTQKEVAERIVAKPGQMSLLSLSVQLCGQPEIVSMVSKESFYPAPEVDSAILKIKVFEKPRIEVNKKDFFRLAKIGFSSKRKTLLNNLSAGLNFSKEETKEILKSAEIKEASRAQELSLKDWQKLLEKLKQNEKSRL